VQRFWARYSVRDDAVEGTCLVTGKDGHVEKVLPGKIKGVRGTPGKGEAFESIGVEPKQATSQQRDDARSWMCERFYDVRMFGAVLSTGQNEGLNAGQVRGPVQLTFARSIGKVLPQDLSITRVAITREADREEKETEFGRKTLIPYGLYIGHGFFSPALAQQTGVTEDDLSLFWQALANMFEVDRSATRGLMSTRGLYVFTHDSPLGNAPAHQLFALIKVEKNGDVAAPRKFEDYNVTVDEAAVPNGVSLQPVVEARLEAVA
jgi:CRISPR-associated protein Csd2